MIMETLHLQGYGKQQAKKAGTIKVGDVLVWNFGATSEVLEIEKETQKQIIVLIKCESGYVGSRRLLKERLVAYK